jgi:hypothetical protein
MSGSRKKRRMMMKIEEGSDFNQPQLHDFAMRSLPIEQAVLKMSHEHVGSVCAMTQTVCACAAAGAAAQLAV